MLKASTEKITGNKRTVLLLIVSSVMSFVLVFGGHWLASNYTKSNGIPATSWITAYLFDFFILMPLIAVGVGAFIGYFEQKRWWLSGVGLMPLLMLILYNSFQPSELVFCAVYLSLCFIASGTVAQGKKPVQTL